MTKFEKAIKEAAETEFQKSLINIAIPMLPDPHKYSADGRIYVLVQVPKRPEINVCVLLSNSPVPEKKKCDDEVYYVWFQIDTTSTQKVKGDIVPEAWLQTWEFKNIEKIK